MKLDKGEILQSYRTAKYKKQQIRILSELNACDKEEIEKILEEAGEKIPKIRNPKPGEPTEMLRAEDKKPARRKKINPEGDNGKSLPDEVFDVLKAELEKLDEEIKYEEEYLSGLKIRYKGISDFMKGAGA